MNQFTSRKVALLALCILFVNGCFLARRGKKSSSYRGYSSSRSYSRSANKSAGVRSWRANSRPSYSSRPSIGSRSSYSPPSRRSSYFSSSPSWSRFSAPRTTTSYSRNPVSWPSSSSSSWSPVLTSPNLPRPRNAGIVFRTDKIKKEIQPLVGPVKTTVSTRIVKARKNPPRRTRSSRRRRRGGVFYANGYIPLIADSYDLVGADIRPVLVNARISVYPAVMSIKSKEDWLWVVLTPPSNYHPDAVSLNSIMLHPGKLKHRRPVITVLGDFSRRRLPKNNLGSGKGVPSAAETVTTVSKSPSGRALGLMMNFSRQALLRALGKPGRHGIQLLARLDDGTYMMAQGSITVVAR